MNSSMAYPYDSCELAAASEFRTAFFDCSKSGSGRIVLALSLVVLFRRAILAASYAAFSMVVHVEAKDPNPFLRTENKSAVPPRPWCVAAHEGGSGSSVWGNVKKNEPTAVAPPSNDRSDRRWQGARS
jgi:hypothetical protein